MKEYGAKEEFQIRIAVQVRDREVRDPKEWHHEYVRVNVTAYDKDAAVKLVEYALTRLLQRSGDD